MQQRPTYATLLRNKKQSSFLQQSATEIQQGEDEAGVFVSQPGPVHLLGSRTQRATDYEICAS
jgi:hypothetical protein